ncbi:MAG TPA: hypothetical protein VLE27_00985 [Thermoanaerobaculia bacterium]|nr:hypothetical protein [Thermoanaerobaculia bacterium]
MTKKSFLAWGVIGFVLLTGLVRQGHASAVPLARTVYAPGVASFNGQIHVFYTRYPDNRIVYQTTTSGLDWSGEILVPLGTTPKNKLSAMAYNNRLYLFYSSASGSSLKYRYLDLAGVWSGELTVGSAATDDGPGLAVFNNLLYVFWETAGSGSDRIRYCTFDLNSLQSGVSVVPFGLTFRGPGAAVFNNRLYLAYSGTNGSTFDGHNIYHGYMDASGFWIGDSRPPGDPRTRTGPALAFLGTELWLMYLPKRDDTFDELYHKKLNTLGQWSAEAQIFLAESETGVSATVFSNRIWLVGSMLNEGDPRSVQYYILP